MVTFDGREPGTEPSRWDDGLENLPALAVDLGRRTVVVAAHPDDESLGAAGLIAYLAARGECVEVIVVTDGSQSHPGSPTIRPADMALLREAEVRRAVESLAPGAPLVMLGYPDGATREHQAAIEQDIRAFLGAERESVRLVAPWRGDGQRDHRVVGDICARIAQDGQAELWEYPIWLWHWASPQDDAVPWDRLRSLALQDSEVVRKSRAIASHHSQLYPLSGQPGDEAVLHPRFVRTFDRDVEVFVVSPSPVRNLGRDYFDDLYDRHEDPWGYADRWYEQRKRDLTLAALPQQAWGRVLEIGSSTGLFTQLLAARADQVIALDLSELAVSRARRRLQGHPYVRIDVADVRDGLPQGQFDLVVLSEVGYYVERSDLLTLADRIRRSLAPDGVVLLCHWRHAIPGSELTGDSVHRVLIRALGLVQLVHHVEADFVLDVLSVDGRSVAQRGELI